MINVHFQVNLVYLQYQIINMSTSEEPISKIDLFSAVGSLISFISLSFIKRYLNSA